MRGERKSIFESVGLMMGGFSLGIGSPFLLVRLLEDQLPAIQNLVVSSFAVVPVLLLGHQAYLLVDCLRGVKSSSHSKQPVTASGLCYSQAAVFFYIAPAIALPNEDGPSIAVGTSGWLICLLLSGGFAFFGWKLKQLEKRALELSRLASEHPDLAIRFLTRIGVGWGYIEPQSVLAYQRRFEECLRTDDPLAQVIESPSDRIRVDTIAKRSPGGAGILRDRSGARVRIRRPAQRAEGGS